MNDQKSHDFSIHVRTQALLMCNTDVFTIDMAFRDVATSLSALNDGSLPNSLLDGAHVISSKPISSNRHFV